MSAVQALYNQWSVTYDAVENKTRDLEKHAGQTLLADIQVPHIIELGCGTGKNTEWLLHQTTALTAVDFSADMMARAREKVQSVHVQFHQADITQPWSFTKQPANLITCSLILEHIEHLNPVFREVNDHLVSGGIFYVCELHPFKQYNGSKARFETTAGTAVLDCYTHHLSDYTNAAVSNGLRIAKVNEWFDENDTAGIPRLVSFIFQKH